MSRELQDVDLAEVKPLVEKGEVSGDAPGCRHHTPLTHGHTCVHTFTHTPTASLFPEVLLSRNAKGQEVSVHVPAWPPSAMARWAGLLAHLSVLFCPRFTYPAA